MKKGLFVGLTTLDLEYLAVAPPTANQKVVAQDYQVSAGGPATNAAVLFSHLGNHSTLLTALGSHPLCQLITTDLKTHSVHYLDLTPDHRDPPPTSSIIVTADSGERAVISLNALRRQAQPERLPQECLTQINVVLIDGHQLAVSQVLASQARQLGIPVVLDGGSWKPGLESVLPFIDYAVCSDTFYPPGCSSCLEVVQFLHQYGIQGIAITRGAESILFWQGEEHGSIPIPGVPVVDTLAAGDFFHGAFCHFILEQPFEPALAASACLASESCRYFGSRHPLFFQSIAGSGTRPEKNVI